MIGTIARSEWKRLFAQPLAWTLLAAALGVLAYFFLLSLDAFLRLMPKLAGMADAPGVGDLVTLPLMRATASLLLLLAPLIGLRGIAGERQAGTLPLLLAAGAGEARIVFGKFVGLAGFFALLIALALAMPLSLGLGGGFDPGRLAAGALGLLLFACALTAIALAASAYADQPVVGAAIALVLNLLLWMADAGARYEGVSSSFINYLALPTHLEPFLHGLVSTVDIVYFVLIAAVALTLAARRLATSRLRG
jgi:ABC-2 type transport system permease protein